MFNYYSYRYLNLEEVLRLWYNKYTVFNNFYQWIV